MPPCQIRFKTVIITLHLIVLSRSLGAKSSIQSSQDTLWKLLRRSHPSTSAFLTSTSMRSWRERILPRPRVTSRWSSWTRGSTSHSNGHDHDLEKCNHNIMSDFDYFTQIRFPENIVCCDCFRNMLTENNRSRPWFHNAATKAEHRKASMDVSEVNDCVLCTISSLTWGLSYCSYCYDVVTTLCSLPGYTKSSAGDNSFIQTVSAPASFYLLC